MFKNGDSYKNYYTFRRSVTNSLFLAYHSEGRDDLQGKNRFKTKIPFGVIINQIVYLFTEDRVLSFRHIMFKYDKDEPILNINHTEIPFMHFFNCNYSSKCFPFIQLLI